MKPSAAVDNRVAIMNQPGGRFITTNTNLKMLIGFAYGVRDFQISGGPDWMESDRWNIEARAEEGTVTRPTGPPNPDVPNPITLMMQSLLEERFALKIRRESRELPVYELVVARGGPKIKLYADQNPFANLPDRVGPSQGPPPPAA